MDELPLSLWPPLPPLGDRLKGAADERDLAAKRTFDMGGEIGLDSKPSLLDMSEGGLIIVEALLPCIAAAKADVGWGRGIWAEAKDGSSMDHRAFPVALSSLQWASPIWSQPTSFQLSGMDESRPVPDGGSCTRHQDIISNWPPSGLLLALQ